MPRLWIAPRLAAITIVVFLGAAPAHAQFGSRDAQNVRSSPAIKAAFKPAVAAPSKSTVRVRADGKDVALGAVVAADGWVITKYDQVKEASAITCKFKDGSDLAAKLVGVQERNDLALLKVNAKGLTPVVWRDSSTAAVGNWVATPGPTDEPVSIGVVSVATRAMTLRDYPPSPLRADSGFLGVMLAPADSGPRIVSLLRDGAAMKAGLEVGDIVLTVSGKKVEDPSEMTNLLSNFKVGDTVSLRVRRGEEFLNFSATLHKRPADPGMDRALFQNGLGRDLSRRNAGFEVALQHDTVLKAIDCGGPLVDLDGKVVAINIASAGRVDSYAVPSELVKSVLPDLMAGKLPPPKVEKKDSKKPATTK
jgi:serine protease Do